MDYVRSQSLSTNNKESKKDLEKIFKVPNLMKIKKYKSKSKKTSNPISDNNKVISQSLKLNEQAIIKPIIKGRNNKTLLLNQSPRSKLRYSMNLKTMMKEIKKIIIQQLINKISITILLKKEILQIKKLLDIKV